MQIDKDIQIEISKLIERGAGVSDLVRFIRQATETTAPGEGRFVVIAYMKRTLQIPLREASILGAWIGFEDGDGTVGDEQLDLKLGPYLERKRRHNCTHTSLAWNPKEPSAL